MSDVLAFLQASGDEFRQARLPSLYADFAAHRHANPEGFEANCAVWLRGLAAAAQAGLLCHGSGESQRFSIKAHPDLAQTLHCKQYGRPDSLAAVLDEAARVRALVILPEFQSRRESIYQKPWRFTPWHVIGWTLRQVGVNELFAASDPILNGSVYVILGNLEHAASKVIAAIGSPSGHLDCIHPRHAFVTWMVRTLSYTDSLSDLDESLLLKFLARDKNAILYNENVRIDEIDDVADIQIVKIRTSPTDTLTPEDETAGSLKSLLGRLECQIEGIKSRISVIDQRLRHDLSSGQRVAAKSALKLQKLHESVLTQRADSMMQIQQLCNDLEQAKDQKVMLDVMRDSSRLLQTLNEQSGGVDKVGEIVEQLGEIQSDTAAIQDMLVSGADVDEAELDHDLEIMAQAQNPPTENKLVTKDPQPQVEPEPERMLEYSS